MNPEQFERIKQIFQHVVDLPVAERDAFLRRECHGDEALASTIRTMIQADSEASSFLEKPATIGSILSHDTPAGIDRTGTQIGGYTVTGILGEGGMGTVYRAEKDDETFRRTVAIKIVRHGMDTKSILQRFYTERRILANLEHPNIARLIDGGMTEDGLPYFIMEYVGGIPITDYCDENQATIKERLQLFVKVCETVQYAHNNLIVHRDLKPSNILVTPEGNVKLLDFGIAKMLTPDDDNDTPTITSAGFPVMTPQYASPEQIRGERITTASDVYSLGVLLYELLSGYRPYEFKTRTPGEIEQTISKTEVIKPSTRISKGGTAKELEAVCRARSLNHDRLRRELTGDLDNMVMMALRKESDRRYQSAGQLLDDIHRYGNNLPVSARPDTVFYRTSKFVRRHSYSVAAALLVALILTAATVISIHQARIAHMERQKTMIRFNDVRSLANRLIFDLHDSIADLPGSTESRRLLVAMGLDYLNNLASEPQNDPELLRELALAYQRIGDVQGNPTNANLGDTEGAFKSYEMALSLVDELIARQPDDPGAQRTLAIISEKMGDVLAWRGEIEKAVDYAERSQSILTALAEKSPDDTELYRALAVSHIKIGDYSGNPNFPNLQDRERALENYYNARDLLENASALDPMNFQIRRYTGLIYERIGIVENARNNPRESLTAFENSLSVRKSLADEYTMHTDIKRDLAVGYEQIGKVYIALDLPEEAVDNMKSAMRIFKELVDADPNNFQAWLSLSISHINAGDALRAAGNNNSGSSALSHYEESRRILTDLRQDDPNSAQVNRLLNVVGNRLGRE